MPDLTGDAEKSRADKITLRTRMLAVRRGKTPAELSAAARLVQDQTLSLVRRHAARTVAAYQPIGSEPGGTDLVRVLAAEVRVLLPVLLPDNDLDWAEYTGRMTDGPRGLREPVGPRLGAPDADLVLVPAVAVDRDGNRMGKGGGSYDRVLARLSPRIPVIALLHDGELLPRVPAEPHDRPVHGTITPTGGFTLSRGAEWTK